MMSEIIIKAYTVSELEKEVKRESFFEGQNHLPITKHRAISQINNPRADKNDVILLIAFQDNQICGYIGMFPDFLFCENKKDKIAWLSTWWVNPKLKGKKLGYKLMQKALLSYNDSILAVAASPHSQKVYQKSGKFDFLPIDASYDFIFKYPLNKNTTTWKKILIKAVNVISIFRINYWAKRNKIGNEYEINESAEFNTELKQFISKKNKNSLFRWNVEEFNWSQNYPWVLSGKREEEKKYYFSSSTNHFEYKNISIKKENQIIAFFILRNRDSFLTVPYLFVEKEEIKTVIKYFGRVIKQDKILSLTITNNQVVSELSNMIPNLKIIKLPNKSVISKKFKDYNLKNITFQDGYGDIILT